MQISARNIIAILTVAIMVLISKSMMFPDYKGPTVIEGPVQMDIEDKRIQHTNLEGDLVDITLMAAYEGAFAVKGVEKYSTDGAAVVSPRDFILAWGRLGEGAVDAEISYSQSNRWYYYRYTGDSLVTGSYISEHSANTHIIPADSAVLDRILKVDKNDYIHLEGYLVKVHFTDGDWTSSLTRKDTGDGSCEILYVTAVY